MGIAEALDRFGVNDEFEQFHADWHVGKSITPRFPKVMAISHHTIDVLNLRTG
jgi:hypothetical protein